MLRIVGIGAAAISIATAAFGQEMPSVERPSNPEMTAIFRADQDARKNWAAADWDKIAAEDAKRRERTRALIDSGALQSGDDFRHAAFIFQHGSTPGDYLVAHTLAMVAVARGQPNATWIAAASLDRYLQAVNQKQIYGTQYSTPPGQPTTQEPYDRNLISDSIRDLLGVPRQAEQEKQRVETEAEFRSKAKKK